MFFFLVSLFIFYLAICCLAVLGPTYLLARFGFARMSLGVALFTTTALTTDFFYNWEGLSYPHVLLQGPTFFFPITILMAVGAIGIAFMACLERL